MQQGNKGYVFINANPKTGLRENYFLEGGFASGLWLQRSPHSKEVLGLNPGYVLCRGCMFSPCLWVLFDYSPKTCILGLGELVSRCPHFIMCGHIQTQCSTQCSTYECVKQGLIWLKGLGGGASHSSACAQNNETGSSKKLWSLCTYLCIWIGEF